jgi:hypothetical protein
VRRRLEDQYLAALAAQHHAADHGPGDDPADGARGRWLHAGAADPLASLIVDDMR